MQVILISEKRLDELVEAMLSRLETRALRTSQDEDTGTLSFRAVNYEVHSLVQEIKKDERGA